MEAEQKMKRCLEKEAGDIQAFRVLWDINFPSLLTFKSSGKSWLIYVTDFRYFSQKVEVVLARADEEAIQEMLSGKKPIREALTEYPNTLNQWTMDLEEANMQLVDAADSDILALLPGTRFLLSPDIPNCIDLKRGLA